LKIEILWVGDIKSQNLNKSNKIIHKEKIIWKKVATQAAINYTNKLFLLVTKLNTFPNSTKKLKMIK
jgi:hypothetical protein